MFLIVEEMDMWPFGNVEEKVEIGDEKSTNKLHPYCD